MNSKNRSEDAVSLENLIKAKSEITDAERDEDEKQCVSYFNENLKSFFRENSEYSESNWLTSWDGKRGDSSNYHTLMRQVFEIMTALYLRDRGFTVSRTASGNRTNLDFLAKKEDFEFYVECVAPGSGNTNTDHSPFVVSGKNTVPGPLGIGEFSSITVDAKDDARRIDLRWTNALAAKHSQVKEFFSSGEIHPVLVFVNSSFMTGRHCTPISNTFLSSAVRSVFGVSGDRNISFLKTATGWKKNGFRYSPRASLEKGPVNISSEGFLTAEFQFISGILHCAYNPQNFLTDWCNNSGPMRENFVSTEFSGQSELILNPKAKCLMDSMIWTNHFPLITVLMEADELRIVRPTVGRNV